jgi:thiamine pyrophosphate-dependent acetolactate synthase large subunit-like protein
MAETASDILVDTLAAWGVEVVFGLPGDGINGIMEALRTRQDRVRFIQARHEEAAAFMATAYAKWTGKLGVCLATTGPGGSHLLTGLYDAKFDRAPVLAITGDNAGVPNGSRRTRCGAYCHPGGCAGPAAVGGQTIAATQGRSPDRLGAAVPLS